LISKHGANAWDRAPNGGGSGSKSSSSGGGGGGSSSEGRGGVAVVVVVVVVERGVGVGIRRRSNDPATSYLPPRCLQKNPMERWSAEELLCHPFITSKSSVHAREAELVQICDAIRNYFFRNPMSELGFRFWI